HNATKKGRNRAALFESCESGVARVAVAPHCAAVEIHGNVISAALSLDATTAATGDCAVVNSCAVGMITALRAAMTGPDARNVRFTPNSGHWNSVPHARVVALCHKQTFALPHYLFAGAAFSINSWLVSASVHSRRATNDHDVDICAVPKTFFHHAWNCF